MSCIFTIRTGLCVGITCNSCRKPELDLGVMNLRNGTGPGLTVASVRSLVQYGSPALAARNREVDPEERPSTEILRSRTEWNASSQLVFMKRVSPLKDCSFKWPEQGDVTS